MRKRDMTPTRNTNLVPNATFVGDRFLGVRLDQDELDHANHLMTSQLYGNVRFQHSSSFLQQLIPEREFEFLYVRTKQS